MTVRAVLTGVGVVAPTGVGTVPYWRATLRGGRAIQPRSRRDPAHPGRRPARRLGPPGPRAGRPAVPAAPAAYGAGGGPRHRRLQQRGGARGGGPGTV